MGRVCRDGDEPETALIPAYCKPLRFDRAHFKMRRQRSISMGMGWLMDAIRKISLSTFFRVRQKS